MKSHAHRKNEPDVLIGGQSYRTYSGDLHPAWHEAATSKGYTLVGRVKDRLHLVVRCQVCGQDHVTKRVVLMDSTPQCPSCQQKLREATARAAGLLFLGADPNDTHYGYYRASCGHTARRQFGFVKRVAAGEVELRCQTCFDDRDAATARGRGWKLVGQDPEGRLGYRLYVHEDGCQREQSIARENMRTGRFDCKTCGMSWTAAASYIYLFRISLPEIGDVLKLGYSRDPVSRLQYQLRLHGTIGTEVLRTVSMDNGHAALREEKKIHALLKRQSPDGVIPPALYEKWLNVKSEIYWPSLFSAISAHLDALEARKL